MYQVLYLMPVGRYTFKYLAPVPQYKVLLSTLYLPPVQGTSKDLVPPPRYKVLYRIRYKQVHGQVHFFLFFLLDYGNVVYLTPVSSSKYGLDMEHFPPGAIVFL